MSTAKACTTIDSPCSRRYARQTNQDHSPVLGRFGHLRHRVQLSPRVFHPPLARHDGPHLARRPLQHFAKEHVLRAEGGSERQEAGNAGAARQNIVETPVVRNMDGSRQVLAAQLRKGVR